MVPCSVVWTQADQNVWSSLQMNIMISSKRNGETTHLEAVSRPKVGHMNIMITDMVFATLRHMKIIVCFYFPGSGL